MADNDTPKANAPKAKPTESTVVGGKVTINTDTFDPRQPLLLDQAVDAFKAQLEDKTLTDVTVTLSQHRIGFSATYDVTGTVTG